MNKVTTLAGLGVILIILFADIALLAKYYAAPDSFSLLSQVSTVHAFLLHTIGRQFAWLKLLASLFMIVCWGRKLVVPARARALKYATMAYALLWALIGLIVLTGVVGTLQYAAGVEIVLHDFSLLVRSMGQAQLACIVSGVVLFPLALIALPALYNRTLKAA